MAALPPIPRNDFILPSTSSASSTPPQRTTAADSHAEELTQQIGRVIFRRLRASETRRPSILKLRELPMRLLMKDEDLRYRMLRFVDVYPALHTSRAVASHLQEYLTSGALATGHPPTTMSSIARLIGKHRVSTQRLIHAASKTGINMMANQFIAGHHPRDVAACVRAMEDEGFLFTLDLLGEFVVSENQADDFQRRYMEIIRTFGNLLGPSRRIHPEAGPRINISIKLSSLASKFEAADPEGTSAAVRARLRPLFREARKRNVFINVDMEKYEYRDLTQQIILDLLDEDEFHGFAQMGTVHQAYLADAEESLRWFLDEIARRGQPMTIRLVKGAYWDSEQIWARARNLPVPVHTDKHQTDACYERCLNLLLCQHRDFRTAVASHNVRSIAHALALKKVFKVPPDRFEVQMLYGMAGPLKDVLRDLGLPVRIYSPCGELIPGMAYLVRRILENTSNESFLRQRFVEHVDEAELLRDPK